MAFPLVGLGAKLLPGIGRGIGKLFGGKKRRAAEAAKQLAQDAAFAAAKIGPVNVVESGDRQTAAQAVTFSSGGKTVTVGEKKWYQKIPVWGWIAIALAVLASLFFFIFKKRKRR